MWVLAFVTATALTPHDAWPVLLVLFSINLATIILSELGIGFVLLRALWAMPFALAALPMLVTMPGAPLWHISLARIELTVTWPGLERFAAVLFKSWLSLQTSLVLVGSTPFPQLLSAMRALHIPRLLVAIVGLMWRYLFVLVNEAWRMMRARDARSGTARTDAPPQPGGNLLWRARVTGWMVGSLFLRAFDRADRIYAAMLARGYDGDVRMLPQAPITPGQRWGLGAGLGTLGILALIGIWGWR